MAPIRRKLVIPIAAIVLFLRKVGGFAVDRPRRGGSSTFWPLLKRSTQTTNEFSHHGHPEPSCGDQLQWQSTETAVFARPHRERVRFMMASKSGGGNANQSKDANGGSGADLASNRVREMAAFVAASLTQALVSKMDTTKEVSSKEQVAMADLLGAVLTPPSPAPASSAPSSLEHDSSKKAQTTDATTTVMPLETSAEAAAVDGEKAIEDRSTDTLVDDELVESETSPQVLASEPTIIDDTVPSKPRLEAALKKALESGENLVEDTSHTADQDESTFPRVPTLEEEKAESLHKKEGDRVVALKDEFATEEVTTENGGAASGEIAVSTDLESQDNEEEEPLPSFSREGIAATTAETAAATTNIDEDRTAISIVTTEGPLRKVETVQNLVPPTPKAVSTAFGRPLPVLVRDVPPLKSLPELAKTEEKASPTENSKNSITVGANSNDEKAETAKGTTVAATAAAATTTAATGTGTVSTPLGAAKEKVAMDEDSYGE